MQKSCGVAMHGRLAACASLRAGNAPLSAIGLIYKLMCTIQNEASRLGSVLGRIVYCTLNGRVSRTQLFTELDVEQTDKKVIADGHVC